MYLNMEFLHGVIRNVLYVYEYGNILENTTGKYPE